MIKTARRVQMINLTLGWCLGRMGKRESPAMFICGTQSEAEGIKEEHWKECNKMKNNIIKKFTRAYGQWLREGKITKKMKL